MLDARHPMGTRCSRVEKHIKENAPHKHVIFLLNKCDLVPTTITVRGLTGRVGRARHWADG